MTDFITFYAFAVFASSLVAAWQEHVGYIKYKAANFSEPFADRLSKIASVVWQVLFAFAIIISYGDLSNWPLDFWQTFFAFMYLFSCRWLLDIPLNLWRNLPPFYAGVSGVSLTDKLLSLVPEWVRGVFKLVLIVFSIWGMIVTQG